MGDLTDGIGWALWFYTLFIAIFVSIVGMAVYVMCRFYDLHPVTTLGVWLHL